MLAQYDISKTYNSFGWGISDDDFVGTQNAVFNLEDIELQVHERYTKPSEAYLWGFIFDKYGWDPTWVKETPNGVFRGNISETLSVSGGQLSGTIGTVIDGMESYGSGTDQINYFFNRTTGGIKKTNYIWTTLLSTITSGYPTGINSEVTAIGWHVTNLLFSKLNIIYFLSTETDICSTAVTLMPGSVVKKIYSYSYDSTIVIAVNWNSTFIYELEFTGWSYNIVSKIESKWYVCIDAVGNEYSLYWTHSKGISQYQGRQNQVVKYISFLSSPRVGWDKQLIIGDQETIYKFGAIKPGRTNILTRYRSIGVIIDIDGSSILYSTSIKSAINLISWSYKRTNTIELLPFDGWNVSIPKADLTYRFGYMFDPGTYTDLTTKQEIEVLVQTDGVEMVNTNTFVSVATITDGETLDSIGNKKYGYIDITPEMIAKSLGTAGYWEQFGYVRTKILLKAGDEFSGNPWYYSKAPRIFDFTINANYVKR